MSRNTMKLYPLADDILRPVLRVAMPRTDARDPRWTAQGAVWSAEFLAPSPYGDEDFSPRIRKFKPLEAKSCPVPFP